LQFLVGSLHFIGCPEETMKFHKKSNNNVIAIMGTWDPVLPRHKALFKKLISYSKKKALNPYIIIFYPNPANFIHENRYKDYFDLDARIELFKHLGINNIIIVEFEREDLRRSATDFFNELFKGTHIVLNELWIGENQSFGTGPEGIFSIRTECADRGINLKILKNSFLVNLDKESVYTNFNKGKFEPVSAIVGYYPTYKLKDDLQINMHDGIYSGGLRIRPFDKTNEVAVTVKIVNQKIEEVNRPDGYNRLILLERMSTA